MLGGKKVGPGCDTYVIAEIGGNFLDFETGKKLIDLAIESGVDAVKLQTYKANNTVTKTAWTDMENTGKAIQYDYFIKYELPENLHYQVFEYCKSKGLFVFSTPSHPEDVIFLDQLGIEAYKIGADDATNIPLLKFIARRNKPILISTGMCTMEEVREAVNSILGEGNDQIILFHTVSSYPTYPEHANLNVIKTFISEFNLPIGLSDHSVGVENSIAARALGACVIEKHFTYDKNAEGPDHMLSADPKEMKQIVNSVRNLDQAMGDFHKKPVGPEILNRLNNRKSVVSVMNIPKGTRITKEMIEIKRPGRGIPPKFIDQVIGRIANVNINEDHIITWDML
ncbi:MAG: N-acetylneuraminate synthase family protein [Lutibacter sp.]|nr:N-acetylneuraminate synthase family protein [Lutibacter sp.]